MQNSLTHAHQQSILAKYKKQISRLRNAMRIGSFSRFSADKKRQLFQCIARYERQLQQWGIAVATGTLLLLPTDGLVAQTPLPVGNEFRVNTYTTDRQQFSFAAMDSDGDFVVVWQSYGQDGSSYGIYAQRYDNTGMPILSEFRVNTYTTFGQKEPSVAMDANGDFVVAWKSYGQDGSQYGIYAQRYDNTGMALGSEFKVNTHTTNKQVDPTVAMDSNGDFVVAWKSYGQDGSSYGIYAQRYDNTGMPQGAEFKVNTYTTQTQVSPSVAMDSAGDFVVAWMSYGQDGNNFGVYAKRYDNTGMPQGAEFRVNTFTTSNQRDPSVAMDSAGDFVVAWHSYGQDGQNSGVYAQRYNNTGVAQGGEFQVNTYTTEFQYNASVAMDSDGDFVVAWNSYGQVMIGQDGDKSGVYAQRYDNAGLASGSEFRVNTYTTSNQSNPSVAINSDGDFVVAWNSFVQDGSFGGIYAQRYMPAPLVPIELLFFTGHAESTVNIVEWATATEKNSAWQIVERSPNGADDWTEIGRIAGAGNSTDPVSYKITDENPLPLSYYRLTSLDFDGSAEHSEVISIQRQEEELSIGNVFPVPAEKEVSLVVNMPASGAVEVSVHSALGQLVYSQNSTLLKGSNDLKIDLRGMPAGNYTVTIGDGFSRVVRQVVKR